MGKGDKKSKRGKIVIGSSGVSRSRKKRKSTRVAPRTAVQPVKEVEDVVIPVAKAAPKKAVKKTEEHTEGAVEKPKAPKTKKKKAEGETELPLEEPVKE